MKSDSTAEGPPAQGTWNVTELWKEAHLRIHRKSLTRDATIVVVESLIRPFRSDDLDDVLEAWYRASLIAHPFLDEDFLARERAEIAEHWLPAADTSVYEINGRVVGFIALIGNEVGGLFVHPDAQRRGVGTALVDASLESRRFLELDVFEANGIGRRFYDGYGFRLVDRHVSEATGLPELRLRLDL